MNVVEFPGLWGLKLEINRVAFEIFGVPIYWYGIIIAFAFLMAVLLGMKNSKLAGIEPDSVLDLVLFAAPAAIICARLFYVIFSWDLFKDNLIDIINTRKGGLAIYGGVIGGFITAYFFARYKKISVLKLLDFGVPYLVMAQGIGRWGNFFNQEAFGGATTLPWRMNSDTVNSFLAAFQSNLDLTKWGVHPTFLYESIWDFAVFSLLIWFRKRKKLDGEVLFLYMILYGAGRFLIEGLRTDSLMLGSLRISQLLAALFVIIFTAAFIFRRNRSKGLEDKEVVEIGKSQFGSVLMKLKDEESKEESDNSVVDGDVENENKETKIHNNDEVATEPNDEVIDEGNKASEETDATMEDNSDKNQ